VKQLDKINPTHSVIWPDIACALQNLDDEAGEVPISFFVALAERDVALAERDVALAERDVALAERDVVADSKIWKLFKPYRAFRT
jgi:hypothetical protein